MGIIRCTHVCLRTMSELPGESELSFLSLICDVLKSLEKDPHDVTTKMTELKNHFQKARECVEKMPGIQCSKSEQLKQIDVLRSQLTIKTELLQKYKSYGVFHLSQ